MEMTPVIAVHVTAALGAVVTGPVALWARLGGKQRPRLHRAFGHAWVTLMIVTAVSALFIRSGLLPNIAGFSPIHLLVPVTLLGLAASFVKLARGDIAGHKTIMQRLYIQACLVAGAFTLLPGRLLGHSLWVEGLGNNFVGRVVAGTPVWVWGLLAALVVLGWTQTRTRSIGLARATLTPIAMTGLSAWSLVSAFGTAPALLATWVAIAAATTAAVLMTQATGIAYDSTTRRFTVEGSWVPMLLILAIFATRYTVNVALAIQPQLKASTEFVFAVAALYGLFTGVFLGRAARLVRTGLRPVQPAPAFNVA